MKSGCLRAYAKTLKLRRRMQTQEGSGFVEVEGAHDYRLATN